MRGQSEKALRKAARRAARPVIPGRAVIVTAIVTAIREDRDEGITPTLLNHEGALIHSLRGGLCLAGMKWAAANDLAREVVAEAFTKAGARRPSWREGQPEYTDGGVIRDTRVRCANCQKPLEWDQRSWCSRTCYDAHKGREAYRNDIEAARLVSRLRSRERRCKTR